MQGTVRVERLGRTDAAHHTGAFADLLCRTVADGGAVGFLAPLDRADAMVFWEMHWREGMVVFAAMQGERLVGTVSLDCALPPNQPHRGDVCKMMVHPDYRRCGIAHQMMVAVEDEARARGFSLLVLDTRSGDAAQSLYAACGFVAVGEIPGYALDPDGRATHGTTVMYRTLSPA